MFSSLMPFRTTVIVERQDGHWNAFFEEFPQITVGAECPSDAIYRLLDLFTGEGVLDDERIDSIDSEIYDGYLVFSIPFRRLFKVPLPSKN